MSFHSQHEMVAATSQEISSHAFASSLPRHHQSEEHMQTSRGQNGSFNRGEPSENWRQVSPSECHDWLADKLRDQSAKVIARKSGQGQRAAESVKQGRNGLTMAHLVSLCRADENFRAEFFRFCGGTLEGEPEMIAALSKAINAVVQRKQGRE